MDVLYLCAAVGLCHAHLVLGTDLYLFVCFYEGGFPEGSVFQDVRRDGLIMFGAC